MTNELPDFLQPNQGSETKRYDRLTWKVKPEPHFVLKSGTADISEPVELDSLAIDLSNMQVGFVKFSGNIPDKIMNNVFEGKPNQPASDWDEVFTIKCYSVNNLEQLIFWDATNWGARLGIMDAFREWNTDYKNKNMSNEHSKSLLPVFTFKGSEPIKKKDGKTITHKPIFHLKEIIANPFVLNGGNQITSPQDSENSMLIPQNVNKQHESNSTLNALKAVKRL